MLDSNNTVYMYIYVYEYVYIYFFERKVSVTSNPYLYQWRNSLQFYNYFHRKMSTRYACNSLTVYALS